MENVFDDNAPDAGLQAGNASLKFLTFRAGQEYFGVPISDIIQIVSKQELVPLPDFPQYTKGVMNLRGEVVPIIDLCERLKKSVPDNRINACIIVVSAGEDILGFLVDSAERVITIGDDMISPAPKVSGDITNPYLDGIVQLDGHIILLLNLGKVLNGRELDEVQQAAEQYARESEPASEEPDEQEEPAACEETNESDAQAEPEITEEKTPETPNGEEISENGQEAGFGEPSGAFTQTGHGGQEKEPSAHDSKEKNLSDFAISFGEFADP